MVLREAGLASLAYFYFDFRDTQKQNLHNALPSLLTQLSARSDHCCNILSRFYEAHNGGACACKPSTSTMITCLKEMLMLPDQGPIYIILDALDECPNTSGIPSARMQVLNLIKDLFGLQLPNLHICVTSRPEIDIRAVLEPLAFQPVSIHEESGQKKDIEDYIRAVVHADSDTAMRRWRDQDRELVIETLTERADGMYEGHILLQMIPTDNLTGSDGCSVSWKCYNIAFRKASGEPFGNYRNRWTKHMTGF